MKQELQPAQGVFPPFTPFPSLTPSPDPSLLAFRRDEVSQRSDDAIRADVTRAMNDDEQVGDQRVDCTVTDGVVTLNGSVAWFYQRAQAEHVVKYLKGVRSVINALCVVPLANVRDVQRHIARALTEHANVETAALTIEVLGSTVTLSGAVSSLAERQIVTDAAWHSPGVLHVNDCLVAQA
ncbi:MAG: BON domain-containing protein [Gemmatimonadaceae bacterium]